MMARSIDASCFAFSTFVVSRKATVRQRSTYVAAPSHALMLPTLTTDTAAHIGGVSAVLEVVSAGCRQRSLKLLRPFAVGLGEPPTPGWKSGQGHAAPCETTGHRRSRPGAVAAPRPGAAAATKLVHESSGRRCAPDAQGAVTPAVPPSVRAVPRIAHRRTLVRTRHRREPFVGRRSMTNALKTRLRSNRRTLHVGTYRSPVSGRHSA
jgi:hypothetical protein